MDTLKLSWKIPSNEFYEFEESLRNKNISFNKENNTFIIDSSNRGNIYLYSVTSFPNNIVFNNGGNIVLHSLTSFPNNIVFNNGGNIYLYSVTSLPSNKYEIFRNRGIVYYDNYNKRFNPQIKSNSSLNNIFLRKLTFNTAPQIREEIILEGTIFDRYKTIIFDLDQTLWDCYTQRGESIGAYQTTPPYKLRSKDIILDIKGNTIQLQNNVRELIDLLDEDDKNLGIVSRGEKLDTPFSAQPSIMILKKFDIFKYFNYNIVIKAFIDKKEYTRPLGPTLFIDDNQEWVSSVNERDDIDVLWRQSFNDWFDLLRKTH